MFAMVLTTLIPITTTGCFGQFALTRKVYAFNQDLSSDRWIRWFGFLAMSVFPIYWAASVIDLAFANSIEFWGGSNPLAASEPPTRHALGPNGEALTAILLGPGLIELRIVDRAGNRETLRVKREADSFAAYDEQGDLVSRIPRGSGTHRVP